VTKSFNFTAPLLRVLSYYNILSKLVYEAYQKDIKKQQAVVPAGDKTAR
jgi:hypothetical protein